jgi:hypothetical protein
MARPRANFDVDLLAPLIEHARRGDAPAILANPDCYERLLALHVAGHALDHDDYCPARIQVDLGTFDAMTRFGVL